MAPQEKKSQMRLGTAIKSDSRNGDYSLIRQTISVYIRRLIALNDAIQVHSAMEKTAFVPAQIRAGRALVGCSQEELATEAGISLTSLREIEGLRRPPDTVVATKIRHALDSLGVAFVPSGPDGGPGVRLVDNRPHIIRAPTTMVMWEGMPFTVEWQGKEVVVMVAREVIEDLGHHPGNETNEVYLKTFNKFRGVILDGVRRAIVEPQNFDDRKKLHVRHKDIAEFNS